MPVSLRPVTADDGRFLLVLYTETRAAEMDLLPWSDTQKTEFVTMQFEAQLSDYSRRFPDAEHSIISSDDLAIGRIWVDRRREEIRLLDITILSEQRNRGVGTGLLLDLQAEAQRLQRPLRHSVYKANEGALRFYARLGFNLVEDYEAYVLMEWMPPTLSG